MNKKPKSVKGTSKKEDKCFKYEEINLSDIVLNKENPRFEKTFSETETIQKIIKDQGVKLVRLAEHIIDKGFNPIDIPILIRKGKKFLVREGNRRIVSLRLVKNPNLVFLNDTLKNQFLLLNSQKGHLSLDKVFCAVFEKDHDADEWIRLKHAVGHKGVGVEKWNSQQTNRFAKKSTRDLPIELQAIDILKNDNQTSQATLDYIPILKASNLKRLLTDPYVRSKIGLKLDDNKLILLDPQKGVLNNLESVVQRISQPGFAVKEIYYKKDKKRFIDSIRLKKIKVIKKPTSTKAKKEDKKKVPSYTSLIDPNKKISSRVGIKISKIYKELQIVSVDSAPHATAFLLRGLIEISVKRYLKKNGIRIDTRDCAFVTISGRSVACDSLRKKINYIANTYITDVDIQRSVRLLNKNSFTTTLNQFIHNQVHQATPTTVRDFWVNAENLFNFLIS